jgi:vesicle-fusing ATPase
VKALQEVTPGFGLDQENFEVYLRKPLVDYGPSFGNIMSILNKLTSIALTGTRQVNSALLYGPPGTGKSSLATHFAKQSKFTYVKIISPERYIGMGTLGRIASITKVFTDAYKSTESLIIIDNIERLIEYVQTGPDFNNSLLQTLFVLLRRIPNNPNCRLLLLGTTSNHSALSLLDLDRAFNLKLKVPLLTRSEAAKLLGVDLNIENASVKRITTFREMVKEKPVSLWPALWQKFSS